MKYLFDEIEHIKLLGRNAGKSAITHCYPLFYTGSGVELNVKGSELYVEFDSSFSTNENYICIYINNALIQRRMIDNCHERICIFRGMDSSSIKNVKILKATQAFGCDPVNYLAITGFDSDGEFLPIDEAVFKIEFIGDSITSGEGLCGAKEDMEWLPMYFDIDGNYAKLTADMLDADFNIISQSGWGVMSSWDNITDNRVPAIYEYVCPTLTDERNIQNGSQEKYDFSSFPADYVVINLGTNDFTAMNGSFDMERINNLTHAVSDFIAMVRKNQPNASILWAYGILDDSLESVISDGIADYIRETNDKKVYYLPIEPISEDDFGSREHPGRAAHERLATAISNRIIGLRIHEL